VERLASRSTFGPMPVTGGRAYPAGMSAEPTPTLASLAQARARRRAALRVLRPVAIAGAVLVAVLTSRAEPSPGLNGERLGVLLAVLVFATGVLGVLWSRRRGAAVQAPFFFAVLASAVALVWLQRHGPGLIGVFVAVGVAAMRVRGWRGVALFAVALGSLAAASALGGDQSWGSILLSELGVVAFYVVARLAGRLRESQEQAEILLLEIDRNREAQAQAAVLAERQRLAREMHDVLAHSLSGLVLQLEGARLLSAGGKASDEIAAAVERAHHLARSGLEEARRAIGMLRDEDLPGPERLSALAREFECDTGVPCASVFTGVERDLGAEARLSVYRVAQEALTNVRKHAAAKRVELRLVYETCGARLTVEDFGDAANRNAKGDGAGYGLAGMRERAKLLGGTLAAEPTATGFRVELWLPA
jgi:signal transduction histidine kinase